MRHIDIKDRNLVKYGVFKMTERENNRKELKADLHGHTIWSLEGVCWYGVESVIEEAIRKGIGMVAITEHSFPWGGLSLKLRVVGRVLEKRQEKKLPSPNVALGEEVTSLDGHIIALGYDPYSRTLQGIPSFLSAEETVRRIHEKGLLAIAAHPTENPTFASLSYQLVEDLAEKYDGFWDGVETTSLRRGIDPRALEIARKLGVPSLGGSDYHRLEEIGRAGVYFPQEAQLYSAQELVDFLRRKPGLTTFVDKEGLSPSRNIFYWLRGQVNKRNGR